MICPRCGSKGRLCLEDFSPWGLHKLGLYSKGSQIKGICSKCGFSSCPVVFLPGGSITQAQAREKAKKNFEEGIDKAPKGKTITWKEAEKILNAKVETNLAIENRPKIWGQEGRENG